MSATTICIAAVTAISAMLPTSVHAQSQSPTPAASAPSAPAAIARARAAIIASQAIAPGGIDDLEAIDIGGIKQWIDVRGNDPSNPILLFIHGGPGSTMMPESWTFQRPWEDFFTVVQWDQRGAGKTFSAAGRRPDTTMTIDEMQSDAEQVIQYLRHKYHQPKIFLMGHSWGSILGARVALHHPEWLYAYIGVGQVVDGRLNEVVGYQQTLARARAVHDDSAVAALEALAPYPNPDGSTPMMKVLTERRWDVALGGMLYGKRTDDEGPIRELSPAYTAYDDTSAQLGVMSSVRVLLPQLAAVSFEQDTVFKCPVFFFAGADDRTTPASLVEDYFRRIRAPEKKLFTIARAAHYVVNEAPGEVLMHLVLDVRPVYRKGEDR